MTAEKLRQAAAKVREVAMAADIGGKPWETYRMPIPGPDCWQGSGVGRVDDEMGHIADAFLPDYAEHIALWSPPVALAVADWLDDIGERHKPDPEPAELCLHYEQDCPTGECEYPGYHTVTACWGCYPTWDGMEGRSVYPCVETKAALKVADLILGGAA